MGGKSETLKYFLIAAALFFGFIYLVVNYAVNKPAQMSYEDEVRNEIYENDSELKMRVYELCADNHSSPDCKYAIEACYKNQSCQNMTTVYQLSVNGSPELNDLSFINASKDYINMERAKAGLPPVK